MKRVKWPVQREFLYRLTLIMNINWGIFKTQDKITLKKGKKNCERKRKKWGNNVYTLNKEWKEMFNFYIETKWKGDKMSGMEENNLIAEIHLI